MLPEIRPGIQPWWTAWCYRWDSLHNYLFFFFNYWPKESFDIIFFCVCFRVFISCLSPKWRSVAASRTWPCFRSVLICTNLSALTRTCTAERSRLCLLTPGCCAEKHPHLQSRREEQSGSADWPRQLPLCRHVCIRRSDGIISVAGIRSRVCNRGVLSFSLYIARVGLRSLTQTGRLRCPTLWRAGWICWHSR